MVNMHGPACWALLLLCSACHRTLSSDLRFFVVYEGKLTRTHTEQVCKENNSTLVTLNTQNDIKLVQNIITNSTQYISIYLGLRLMPPNTTMNWSNGEPVSFNAPSDGVTSQPLCAAVDGNVWKHISCDEKIYFMCSTNTSYQLVKKKKRDWCGALRYCRRHHIDLVSIVNDEQNKDVIAKGANTTFWIGLKRAEFQWDDGQCSTVYPKYPEDDKYKCVCLNNGTVKSTECEQDRKVMCMRGKAKILLTPPDKNRTWEEAFDYCKNNHNGLVFIRGAAEQEALEQWLSYQKGGSFWIGLRQSRLMGFWIWTSLDKVVDYDQWHGGQAPKLPLSHHCGAVVRQGEKVYWKDVNCKTQLPALCLEDLSPPWDKKGLSSYP